MLKETSNLLLPILNLYSWEVQNVKFVNFQYSSIFVVYTFYVNTTYIIVGKTRWAKPLLVLWGFFLRGRGVFCFLGFFCLLVEPDS